MSKKLFKYSVAILAAFAFVILWLSLIKWVLPYLISTGWSGYSLTPLGVFFFACILAPLWEEAAFRHAPLQLVKKFKDRLQMDLTVPVVILSSAIFGWGHGAGPISIMIQGIGGLAFSWLYISNNYNYWSSVVLHFLWNFSILFVFPSFITEYGVRLF